MKKLIGLLLILSGLFCYGQVVVTGVNAQQRYPWNGKVDIYVTMTGSMDEVARTECAIVVTNMETDASLKIESLKIVGGDVGSDEIWTRHYVWDANKDVDEVVIDNVLINVNVVLGGVQLWEDGPFWADSNIGAEMSGDVGYYFWWGDTIGYKRSGSSWVAADGSRVGFSFTDSNCPTRRMTRLQLQSSGYVDSTGNLVSAYDAATTHLGSPWRMPTDAEFSALFSNCTTTWASRNGVPGRLVTGKGAYSTKSIFLPAAGKVSDAVCNWRNEYGYYWSATATPQYENNSYSYFISRDSYFLYQYTYRAEGCSIRPVRSVDSKATAESGASIRVSLDCRKGIRTAGIREKIVYSPIWECGENYITNGGFEETSIVSNNGDWSYCNGEVTSLPWTQECDSDSSGLAKRRCIWVNKTDMPIGNYCAFIQKQGVLKQSFSVPVSGKYAIELVSAARVETALGHVVNVSFDDEDACMSITSENAEHVTNRKEVFLEEGAHILYLKGQPTDKDSSTLIDNISLKLVEASQVVAELAINGQVVVSSESEGVYEWIPTRNGSYELTHVTKLNGEQFGETLSAIFVVEGLNPDDPVITPASGTAFVDSLSISMICDSEGAAVYYTTDGSEPTMESTKYMKRFRISGKTTVKARAFYEDGTGSEIVTAEYALGQCSEPVISTTGGEMFYHNGNQISIVYDCEEGVVHYTTDGSEPTADSPIYTAPFTTDESMVVKAKAFSDNYFDSEVVTATLTREWEPVATPVISAAESFTGSKTKVSIACATEGALIRYTTDGSEPNSHSKRYSGPFEVRETTTVKAYAILSDYTNSEVAAKTITKNWGIGDSVGLPDHKFTTEGAAGWVDDSGVMKSGAITHNETSILKSTFVGKGKLAFEVKLACEEDDPPEYIEFDHYELWIDGACVYKMDGIHDWTAYSYDLLEGSHEIEWRYVKDEQDDPSTPDPDGVWLRNIVWSPEKTQASEVKVELAWLKMHFPTLGSYYFDYEEKANETAANGINTVWEAYLIGLDPTDSAAKFVSSIAFEDGKPVVTWDPDLGGARAYTILGSTDLKTWTPVEEGRASDYNFFKVAIEMK